MTETKFVTRMTISTIFKCPIKCRHSTGLHKTHLKKAYDSFGREVLYKILNESGKPTKLVRLIKMILNKIYSEVCKHLSDTLPSQNGLKQGDTLLPLLFNFTLEYATGKA
jgi:hypothetical protein